MMGPNESKYVPFPPHLMRASATTIWPQRSMQPQPRSEVKPEEAISAKSLLYVHHNRLSTTEYSSSRSECKRNRCEGVPGGVTVR